MTRPRYSQVDVADLDGVSRRHRESDPIFALTGFFTALRPVSAVVTVGFKRVFQAQARGHFRLFHTVPLRTDDDGGEGMRKRLRQTTGHAFHGKMHLIRAHGSGTQQGQSQSGQ